MKADCSWSEMLFCTSWGLSSDVNTEGFYEDGMKAGQLGEIKIWSPD